MKRKEKNVTIKKMADALDHVLVTQQLHPEKAAEIIGLLRECDEGMYLDHSKRGYHELIKTGKLVLERTIERE